MDAQTVEAALPAGKARAIFRLYSDLLKQNPEADKSELAEIATEFIFGLLGES